MLPIPLHPKVIDRPALEDGKEYKRHPEETDRKHGPPEQPPHLSRREDAQIERQHGELDQGDEEEIHDSQGVEEAAKVVDLGVGQGPDIKAEAIGAYTVDIVDGVGDAR